MKKMRHKAAPNAGFTIVEVLIVLAMAGLILSIIFLALPALERNSRNNQRKQDIQVILEAVSHWELNNSGNVPAWDPVSGSATNCDNFLQFYISQFSYYTPYTGACPNVTANNPIKVAPFTLGTNSGTINEVANFNTDTVLVYNHQKCKATIGTGSTGVGASYTDVVALYALETGGSASAQCQQL